MIHDSFVILIYNFRLILLFWWNDDSCVRCWGFDAQKDARGYPLVMSNFCLWLILCCPTPGPVVSRNPHSRHRVLGMDSVLIPSVAFNLEYPLILFRKNVRFITPEALMKPNELCGAPCGIEKSIVFVFHRIVMKIKMRTIFFALIFNLNLTFNGLINKGFSRTFLMVVK